ncbi:MAG: transcriptional regulator [Acidobacteria bacterium]|nr:transcriptional regulator [Acidobacteriota bacterium]
MKSPVDVGERFSESRFGRACHVIEDDLRDVVDGGDMVAALTDRSVTISWMVGGRRMLRNAEKVHFVVGGQWSEDAVGTNALALAEKLVKPAMVFSAEHFLPVVHDWVCYSAPIFDPRTGEFQGVVDISSLWSKTNPSLLTTVRALARCVQYELSRVDDTSTTLGSGPLTRIEIRTLGTTELRVNNVPIRVSRRQMEIIAVLAMYPSGLSLDELTTHVYGDHSVSPATVKAELSHLRTKLGGAIGSRPYQLIGQVDADYVRVLQSLANNDLAGAVGAYQGSMMPHSASPVIETCRHQIDVALSDAVVSSKDPELLFQLSNNCPDDEFVLERALEALDRSDARSGLVAGRLWRP